MPCPSCGSNDLWDDNLAWGCMRCDWFTTGNVQNTGSKYDRFHQPDGRVVPLYADPVPASHQPRNQGEDDPHPDEGGYLNRWTGDRDY